MTEQLYSAEEAAAILGLQVRTVRNYVREGRLPGVRIGKQYRITRADLEAFTGGGAVQSAALPAPPQPNPRAVETSSVVQVTGIESEAADRIARTLTAALAGRSASDAQLRVEPLYDEQRLRLKVIIVGPPADAIEMIRIIEALSDAV